jgi:hypothetical protein
VLPPVVTASAPLAAAAPAEDGEITYEEALKRKEQRDLEEAKLLCSLENKEACLSAFTSPPLPVFPILTFSLAVCSG